MKVFINPGHGAKRNGVIDPGAIGPGGSKEVVVNMQIAAKLKQLMTMDGIDTVIYQSGDLSEVVRQANISASDYLISIHCNAFSEPTANGTETLIMARGGKAEQLAEAVQARLIRATRLADRGVKIRPTLKVLNSTSMPAILVETAFITNPAEEKLLISDHFQTTTAQAIFAGFVDATGYAGSLSREECQKIIQDKCKFSHPDEVWKVINTHKHADAVYQKLAIALRCK